MTRLWLTSISTTAPVAIGADRMAVDAAADWDTFRRTLHAVHPRLLPLFKARLLVADDDDAYCGGAESKVLELDGSQAIVFDGDADTDGERLLLSHCAEAFLERLLAPLEALQMTQMARIGDQALTERQKLWLETMLHWWRQGFSVVLLLED